jgi:Phytanoyl-CoA dioxygenase (PhyH)
VVTFMKTEVLEPPTDEETLRLSDQQVRAFCAFGYCVSRIPLAQEITQRAIDKVWELCPSSFRPDKPRTWQGEFQDSCKTQSIRDRLGRVKFRECLRGERWLYDMTAANPDILACIRELIGEPVPPEYVRGLYPVFPTRSRAPHGHCDRHKFQVGVVLYLSDALPVGGGFTVWPGSHHEIARHHRTLGGEDRWPTYEAALKEVERSTQPVEVTGPAGTVVLWHQRLVHTAGINTRRAVRHATLCDFKNDTFLSAAESPASDLWSTWSPRVQEAAT